MLSNNHLLILSVIIIVLISFFLFKRKSVEYFDDPIKQQLNLNETNNLEQNVTLQQYYNTNSNEFPVSKMNEDEEQAKQFEKQLKRQMEVQPLNASELLPKDYKPDWFEDGFDKIEEVDQQKLIDMGEFIITEPNNVIRNAVRDLRGSISIPKKMISPFLNSSIQPENTQVDGICSM